MTGCCCCCGGGGGCSRDGGGGMFGFIGLWIGIDGIKTLGVTTDGRKFGEIGMDLYTGAGGTIVPTPNICGGGGKIGLKCVGIYLFTNGSTDDPMGGFMGNDNFASNGRLDSS